MDDEEYSYAALQEPLYRVETGNYEYRLGRINCLIIICHVNVITNSLMSCISSVFVFSDGKVRQGVFCYCKENHLFLLYLVIFYMYLNVALLGLTDAMYFVSAG